MATCFMISIPVRCNASGRHKRNCLLVASFSFAALTSVLDTLESIGHRMLMKASNSASHSVLEPSIRNVAKPLICSTNARTSSMALSTRIMLQIALINVLSLKRARRSSGRIPKYGLNSAGVSASPCQVNSSNLQKSTQFLAATYVSKSRSTANSK